MTINFDKMNAEYHKNPGAWTGAMPSSDTYNRFRFSDEFDMMNMLPPEFLVEGIFTEATTNILYGGKGSLKTFLLLGMCMSITYDVPFHGRAVKPGAVAYVCGEGGPSIGKRIAAWRHYNSIDTKAKSPFYILNRPIKITEEEEVEAFISHLQAMEREHTIKFKMVAFDTLSKMLNGAKEDQDVIARVINLANVIRDKMNVCVVFAHHAGKDAERGARGSSVIGCDSDGVFSMTRHGGKNSPQGTGKTRDDVSLYAEKIKDAPDDWTLDFRAKLVDLPFRAGVGFESSLVLEGGEMSDAVGGVISPAELLRQIIQTMGVGDWSLGAITVKMGKHKGRFSDSIREAVPTKRTIVTTPDGLRAVRRIEEMPPKKGATITIEEVD